MPDRLTQLFSWWFILQIVLPFTAPLQTLDLHDLMGHTHHHSATAPESSTTPTISEMSVSAFATGLAPAMLDAFTSVAVARALPVRGPLASAFSLSPAPYHQHPVLRL